MKTKLALFLVATLSASIHAQVLPNEAVVDGKTIGEWSAAWWQWLFTIPTNQNPVFDQDGSRAQVAQPGGDVFFLCGVLNISGQATRTITVPEDEYLFFAIVANEWNNIDTVPPYTVEQLRDLAAAATALTTELRASIDGVPVQDLFTHRAMSPVFSVDFQSPDNLQTFAYGHPIVGLVDPIVLDGYWLMVAPLGAGPHVINFGAILGPPVNFTLDITYNISVLPIPLPQRVAGLVQELERSDLPANRQQPLLAS